MEERNRGQRTTHAFTCAWCESHKYTEQYFRSVCQSINTEAVGTTISIELKQINKLNTSRLSSANSQQHIYGDVPQVYCDGRRLPQDQPFVTQESIEWFTFFSTSCFLLKYRPFIILNGSLRKFSIRRFHSLYNEWLINPSMDDATFFP